MWNANGNAIQMVEGDYGLTLPIEIHGTTLSAADRIKLAIKTGKNGETLLERSMVPTDNIVNFSLTQAESQTLGVGSYVYCLDWYQDGNFMCNLISAGAFKVVDKA